LTILKHRRRPASFGSAHIVPVTNGFNPGCLPFIYSSSSVGVKIGRSALSSITRILFPRLKSRQISITTSRRALSDFDVSTLKAFGMVPSLIKRLKQLGIDESKTTGLRWKGYTVRIQIRGRDDDGQFVSRKSIMLKAVRAAQLYSSEWSAYWEISRICRRNRQLRE